MSEKSPPASGADLTIRPGDVIEIPAGAEPGRPARSLIQVLSASYRYGDECGILRGYTINADGSRRRGQREPRTAYPVWRRLAPATLTVQVGAEIQPVPLVVAPDEERALPLLPVLTWEQAKAVFGFDWPNSGVYLAAHVHRHEQCGHLTRCGFPDESQPCQAYESHDETCWDCQLPRSTPPADDAEQLLADAVQRIRRRYPDVTALYINLPEGGDDNQVILCNIQGAHGDLWPDEQGEVFQGPQDPGERLWLGERDGDPFGELAEINRLLTEVYRKRGATLFEPGELGGGWYLTVAR